MEVATAWNMNIKNIDENETVTDLLWTKNILARRNKTHDHNKNITDRSDTVSGFCLPMN